MYSAQTARFLGLERNSQRETSKTQRFDVRDDTAPRHLLVQTEVTPSNAALDALRATLEASGSISFPGKTRVPTVEELSRAYLDLRGRELRWGGFKSVRYSAGLFTSKYHDRRVTSLTRDDGREFLGLIARLSTP